MEKIIAITEYTGEFDNEGHNWTTSGDGYKVITDKQEIVLLIANYQSCCEDWGYFFCNDNPQDFIGANLLNVTLTDTALNEAFLTTRGLYEIYGGGLMFVNLETDKGTLQFVAYNEHNGYYGHAAVVKSTQLTHTDTL